MRIQLKGRGSATADEELLSRLEKKLEKVARQVSPLAECTIELREERGEQVADGALKLKGVTLRAQETGSDAAHALNLVADDLCAPGEEAPRQASRPPRGAPRGRRGARGLNTAENGRPEAGSATLRLATVALLCRFWTARFA